MSLSFVGLGYIFKQFICGFGSKINFAYRSGCDLDCAGSKNLAKLQKIQKDFACCPPACENS